MRRPERTATGGRGAPADRSRRAGCQTDPMGEPPDNITRCEWANGEFLVPYHDEEWGVPVHDDRRHYEFLVLEAAQGGPSSGTRPRPPGGDPPAFCSFRPPAG